MLSGAPKPSLTDAQQRALAYDKSLCVTASAGTGKTHTLVSRYLHLLEQSGCKPSEILALTFTDKAAAEMKNRLVKEIYEKEGDYWNEIKDALIGARLSTFHSFCWGLIKEFSFESGLDRSGSVPNEAALATIIEDGIQRLFTRREQDEVRKATARCLIAWGESQTRTCLEILYKKRHISRAFFAAFASDPAERISQWQNCVASVRNDVVESLTSDPAFREALQSLVQYAEDFGGDGDAATRYLREIHPHLEVALSDGSPEALCDALVSLATIRGGRTNMGSKKVFGDRVTGLRESYIAMSARVKALPTGVLTLNFDPASPAMTLTLDLVRDLDVMFSSFSRDIEQEKRRAGVIDYTDMINLAYRMVHENPSIGETLNRRYRFIMVDEFQDTDPVQNGIILKILSFGDDNPKKLFVVGDPKQSIYLFRDADVTQFKETNDSIKKWGGEELPLDENFRSTPAVIQFVNGLFGRIFAETKNDWDFLYKQVSPTKDRQDDAGSVELLITPKGDTAQQSAILEFDTLAKKIGTLVRSGEKAVYWDANGKHITTPRAATYRDSAILIETRTHLLYLLSALTAHEIPFRVHGGLGFWQTQEVVDVCNVLSFLCNPSDDIALYGALRSPFFGLSDADIFSLCGGRGEGLYRHCRQAQDKRIRRMAAILSRWLNEARRIPPSELIRHIFDDTDIYVVYAALPDGLQRISNLEKFCDYVSGSERLGFYTIDRLVRDLTLLIDTEEREGEADAASDDDVVSVMTVHAAKGLEFPIVWVPRVSESMRTRSDAIEVDYRLGIGIKLPSTEKAGTLERSPPSALMDYFNRQKDFAEYKRLFYVATTRAKDHLILSGTEIDPDSVSENPAEYTSRMKMMLGHFRIPIPEEGESLDYTGIPDVSFRISHCNRSGTRMFDTTQRELIEPTTPDSLAFPEFRTLRPDIDRADRIFSPSEIELYSRSPDLHRERYIEKTPETSSLAVSVFEDQPWTEGQVIHEVFSGIPPATVLRSRGLPLKEERIEYYQTLYDRFWSSPIVAGREQHHVEFPFLLNVDGFRIQGYIDLLLRTRIGWAVIDYKTGKPGNGEEYALQLAVYTMAAESITGEKVKAYLYFTENSEFVEIDPDLKKIRTEICTACSSILESENV